MLIIMFIVIQYGFIQQVGVIICWEQIMLNFFGQHSLVEGDYSLNQIQVLEEIGRGNSRVYNATIKGQNYALKQMEVKSDYEYQNFLKEISLMKDMSEISTCMVKYIGYFITVMEINQYTRQKYAFIIMECAETNLQNFIAEAKCNSKLTKHEILTILDFLVKAFAQLEENKIAHCDIKPENILIMDSSKITIKLCDVGSCKVISNEAMEEATIYGTVPFLAPQLIKTKSQKIISSNPFKSDVFSFGLVMLYVIIQKKFTSKERLEVNEDTYFQVISEWVKEARELTSYDSRISEVLRCSLEFDEFKRPLFKEIKKVYDNQRKTKKLALDAKLKSLKSEEEEEKQEIVTGEKISYDSVPLTRLNLFKSRNLTKINTKTGTGFMKNKNQSINSPATTATKLKRKNSGANSPFSRSGSPSPMAKRQNSCFSSSPDKVNTSILDFKKIIYVTEEDKDFIPYEYLAQEEKMFVLVTPTVNFKKAEVVTILSTCSLGVVYDLAQVEGRKLYVQYEGVEGIGLAEDAPLVGFSRIYVNLQKTQLVGGYRDILRVFCPIEIQVLEINITKSDATIQEVYGLLDRFNYREKLKIFSLCWEDNILSAEEHFQMTEKLGKISLKKLTLIMNGNFIKYDQEARWLLPKDLEILYLEYKHNFLGKVISNLSISLTKTHLRELYLDLENNNLSKGEVNFLIKSICSIETLEKLVINLSMNPLDDITYVTSLLVQLKNVVLLQIKLYKTGIKFNKICQAVSDIKHLFDRKLKILKLGYDRQMKKFQFTESLEKCLEDMKSLVINVVGYDHRYFMAFIKKKDKMPKSSSKAINSNRIKGEKKNHLGFKTMEEKQPKIKGGQCCSFYSGVATYENYMCLACCDMRELSKTQFFCKYCIQNCGHRGHNMVKIYERRRCACSYGQRCRTEITKKICAQKLNIKYKIKYDCQKCKQMFCSGCVQRCQQLHKKWVEESKEYCYFNCGSCI